MRVAHLHQHAAGNLLVLQTQFPIGTNAAQNAQVLFCAKYFKGRLIVSGSDYDLGEYFHECARRSLVNRAIESHNTPKG